MAAKRQEMALSEIATEKVLPVEIWHQIWENLDFQNRQKICVLVCQTWKFQIRNQPKFSSEVKLKTMDHELEDINAILSSWPVLERLYVTCQKEMPRLGLKLKFQEVNCLEELDSVGEVKMLCLDPKNIQAPVEMKHISWFQINESSEFLGFHFNGFGHFKERKIELETKLREMRNLSILSIDVNYSPCDFEFDLFNMDWFSSLGLENVNWIELFSEIHGKCQLDRIIFRNSHHLEMKRQKKKLSKTISISHLYGDCYEKFEELLKNIPEFQLILQKSNFIIRMQQFLGILNSMSKIKNLIIDGKECIQGDVGSYFLEVNHEIGNRLNEKDTEKCFHNAMEIIDKFPRDETNFVIRETEYGLAIKKTKGNPPELTRIFEDGNGQVI